MRVLLVSHLALPHYRAGVEAYTHQLAHELGQRGEVWVASTRKVITRATGTVRRFEHDGVRGFEVIQNLDGEAYESTYRSERMEAAFRQILAETKPDIVHFQHLMYWSVELPNIAREAGARTLLTMHDFYLMCARMGQRIDASGLGCTGPSASECGPCMATMTWGQSANARKWIKRLTSIRSATGVPLDGPLKKLQKLRSRDSVSVPNAPSAEQVEAWTGRFERRTDAFRQVVNDLDVLVTPSAALRQRFVDWGIPEDRIRRVPQGLDGSPFDGVARSPSDRLRLAFVGTIAPHKGVLELIQAARRLPEDRVRLNVYGRTDLLPDYMAQCTAAVGQAENITFRGWLTRDQLPATYREIDVLCVPSKWDECCPLTIQEAFLCGVPCVVSGRGGMAELVRDGVDGLHARDGDVDDWERALRRLVDQPELRDELAGNVPQVPSVQEHVDRLVAVYESLGRSAQ